MFKILYRIIREWNEGLATSDENSFVYDDDVLGFFEINVNGNGYGYYHNKPLRDGEGESAGLSSWFIGLIKAYQKLCTANYVALDDTDSYIIWLEFKKVQDMVQISIIRAEKKKGRWNYA